MTESYLALLRAINVGGKNKLPMPALRELFVDAGCQEVQSYIQSGNVLFKAEPQAVSPLPALLSASIAERFDLRVPIILRSQAQLADVLSHNPFIEEGAALEALHVLFLAHSPTAERVSALDPDRSPPDVYRVRGQEIYLCLPNGAGNTKLTNAYFDSKLATISTGRNWRTVTTLFEMISA